MRSRCTALKAVRKEVFILTIKMSPTDTTIPGAEGLAFGLPILNFGHDWKVMSEATDGSELILANMASEDPNLVETLRFARRTKTNGYNGAGIAVANQAPNSQTMQLLVELRGYAVSQNSVTGLDVVYPQHRIGVTVDVPLSSEIGGGEVFGLVGRAFAALFEQHSVTADWMESALRGVLSKQAM